MINNFSDDHAIRVTENRCISIPFHLFQCVIFTTNGLYWGKGNDNDQESTIAKIPITLIDICEVTLLEVCFVSFILL